MCGPCGPLVLAILARELPVLRERFGVASIGVFGSVSRGEDTPESDVDVLVTYRPGQATFVNIMYLEEYLGIGFVWPESRGCSGGRREPVYETGY